MPAESQAQRGYLAWRFGPAWMRQHHFDNKGPLPQRVGMQVGGVMPPVYDRQPPNRDQFNIMGRPQMTQSGIDIAQNVLNTPGGRAAQGLPPLPTADSGMLQGGGPKAMPKPGPTPDFGFKPGTSSIGTMPPILPPGGGIGNIGGPMPPQIVPPTPGTGIPPSTNPWDEFGQRPDMGKINKGLQFARGGIAPHIAYQKMMNRRGY
jgi:hypothetical protein